MYTYLPLLEMCATNDYIKIDNDPRAIVQSIDFFNKSMHSSKYPKSAHVAWPL